MFTVSLLSLQNVYYYDFVYVLSFRSPINPDQYGVDDFGYRLWDLKNRKIIRSRDVVFNEKVMYKYQLQGKKEEKENTKYTVLDEIKENEVPKEPENQEKQQVPQNPTNVRRYTRLSRPFERLTCQLKLTHVGSSYTCRLK